MVLNSARPVTYPDLPAPRLIKYVRRTARGRNSCGMPAKKASFGDDEYVQQPLYPLGALHVPVQHQNELRAVLYLENDLTGGAFTRSAAGPTTSAGSSQAAISIDNAQLYDDSGAAGGRAHPRSCAKKSKNGPGYRKS